MKRSNENIILFIDHDKFLTGSTVSLLYLISAFVTDGFKVFVLSPKGIIEREVLTKNGANVIPYVSSFMKSASLDLHFDSEFTLFKWNSLLLICKDIYRALWGMFFTYKAIRKIRPSIIYINEYVLIQSAIIGYLLKIPVVMHVRSLFAPGKYGLRKIALKWCILHFSDLIIVITGQEKKQLLSKDEQNTKIKVVPEFLDDDNFRLNYDYPIIKKKYGIPEKKKIILTVGGDYPIKGTLDLLLAANELLKENKNYFFVIAGKMNSSTGDFSQYNKECYNLISMYPENIITPGLVGNIIEYIAVCDILVAPLTKSHFCRPIIEAWAQKKPIITTKLAHTLEYVEDKKNGILVDVKDYKCIAQWISYISENPDFANSLGQNGYEVAIKKHKYSNNIEEIIRLCKGLV